MSQTKHEAKSSTIELALTHAEILWLRGAITENESLMNEAWDSQEDIFLGLTKKLKKAQDDLMSANLAKLSGGATQ